MTLKKKYLFTGSCLIILVSFLYNKYLNDKSELDLKKLHEWVDDKKFRLDKIEIKKIIFKIEYNHKEWLYLLHKLNSTRFFSRLSESSRFEYGFDPEYAKMLANYWRTQFDWKSTVNHLNKYPQFKILINNTIIHYIKYTTNKNKSIISNYNLLLIDGWPGSFFCFYEMLNYLEVIYQDYSFNVIIPSIPGYGYSNPLHKKIGIIETSFLFDALTRHEFGEDCNYFIHGEDWGSLIATSMAKLFPNNVKGIHITLPVVSELNDFKIFFYNLYSKLFPSKFYTEQEIRFDFPLRNSIKNRLKKLWNDFGYMHLQATKPDTLGHGLFDSPVGLLAYILEKYSSWSFNFDTEIINYSDGGLEKYNKNDLLTIVTLYWMTNSITSSIRFYKHSTLSIFGFEDDEIKIFSLKTPNNVSVAVQYFQNEINLMPYKIINLKYTRLVRYNIYANGGHFAAFENPQLTSKDLVEFLQSI